MSLRDVLNSIVQGVDGAVAAVIMAYDGISIEEVTVEKSDFDAQLLSVEYATLLKDIKLAVGAMRTGDIEEVSITTSQTHVVMRVLNDELFVALIMGRSGNYGKGRYLLKSIFKELIRELG